jgi:predicted O-methyltransferase YrrM
MTDAIDTYIRAHIDSEGTLLAALSRDAHTKLLNPQMMAGHIQGRLLKMICRIMQPKRVLEIGTYTAYATLCIAEGLPDDAHIHSIEINDEMEPFIQPWIQQSPHREKIQLHWGDATRILPTLEEPFDIVFIDADKRQYSTYYDLVFPHVRPKGIILADNTLWYGKVTRTETPSSDRQTQGIRAFNEKIKNDARVEKVILPLRDGLTIIYKL